MYTSFNFDVELGETMKMYVIKLSQLLGLIGATAFPMQVSSAELNGFDAPTLVLSDAAGLPYYPTETHTFNSYVFDDVTVQAPARQVATAQTRRLAPTTTVEEKAPAAVALRATVLRRSEDLVRVQQPQSFAPGGFMDNDIMDSWSVGVFR